MTQKNENDKRGVADHDLSAWLRAQRERAGMSVDAICQRTKIHPKFIRALESGDFKVLPSTTHMRAFCVTYAKVCDADTSRVLELLAIALGRPVGTAPTGAVQTDLSHRSREPSVRSVLGRMEAKAEMDSDENRGTLWLGMAVGVALVLWVLTRLSAPGASASLNQHRAEEKHSAKVSKNEALEGARSKVSVPSKKTKKTKIQLTKVPTVEHLKPLRSAEGQADQALTVRAAEDCWLVVKVDGRRLPVVVLAANEKKVWYFRQRLVMLAGNAGSLKAWWRGNSLGLLGREGERKNGLVFEKGQAMRQLGDAQLELPAGVAVLQLPVSEN